MSDPRCHTNAELEAEVLQPTPPPVRGRRFLAPTGSGGNGAYVTQPLRGVSEVQAGASEAAARAVEVPRDVVERVAAATTLYDEPESIGDAVASYTEVAHRIDSLRRAAEIEDMRERRKALRLEHRLEDARQRAKRRHVNVRNDLFVISRMLERARRAGNGEPAAAVKRMEAVEARLDGAGVSS